MAARLALSSVVLLLLLAFAAASTPPHNATELSHQLGTLPECALSCATSLASPSCPLSDFDCLCGDAYPANGSSPTQQCIMMRCSVKEELQAQRILQGACGRPPRDARTTVLAVVTTFCAIAIVLCAIRIAIRARSWALLGLDDICIFVASMTSCGLLAGTYIQVQAGLGRDMWGVEYNDIFDMFFWIYVVQILYVCCTYLTKLSVLCFYLRVFTEPDFAWKTYVLLGLTAASFAAVLFSTIFQCTPVSFVWTSWARLEQHGGGGGRCLPLMTTIYLNAIPNIALDCMILLLPIPTLVGLTLGTARKLGLFFVFSLGIFTIVVAALRLQTLIRASKSFFDVTYTLRLPAYWSLVEVYVGIVCVCLPAARTFFRAARDTFLGGSQRRRRRYEQYYDDSDGPAGRGPAGGFDPTATAATDSTAGSRHSADSYKPGRSDLTVELAEYREETGKEKESAKDMV